MKFTFRGFSGGMPAAKVLGAAGPLLSVLIHFFEQRGWGCPVETGLEGQTLTAEDQLLILMQASLYLSATRGIQVPEARICYERAESLCHSLNRPRLLSVALLGQWRYSVVTDKMSAAMRIAERVHSLAQEQNDSALLLKAYLALAVTLHYSGDFESARQNAMRGVQTWRSGGVRLQVEDVDAPAVRCLCFLALSEWHLGVNASWQATMAEAISLAKDLNDMHALALAIWHAAVLGYLERSTAEVDRLASALIELSTRQNFALWLTGGAILRGWARSVSGDTTQGISWIEDGLADQRAIGAILFVPLSLGLKAEALHLADRTSEALEAIREAVAIIERFGMRSVCAELHRLRGVFLAATGADEIKIEASFCEAIKIATEQKSISLAQRAEATYAEYRRQKASASGGRGFRLPLC